MTEKELQNAQERLKKSMQRFYGNDAETVEILNDIIYNCESKIKRRIKASSLSQVYDKYYDKLYLMVKLDYQQIGSEGEQSRKMSDNDVTFKQTSNDVLATIPQRI